MTHPTTDRLPQTPPYVHIVWDWNGTLKDDVGDLLDAVNHTLAGLRAAPIDLATYQAQHTVPHRAAVPDLEFPCSTPISSCTTTSAAPPTRSAPTTPDPPPGTTCTVGPIATRQTSARTTRCPPSPFPRRT
jgi:hypothetical protein